MAKRSVGDIEKIWSNVESVKTLSDRAIGIGPFGIGLDGLLAFIPGVGLVYTVGAAGWLLIQAMRANASAGALAQMIACLGIDTVTTLTGETLFLPADVVDILFPGHLLAAKALQKDIETTHWVEANEREARASGEHERHVAAMRADPGKRRIVYLHD
jgi:hypothetical protein